MAKKPSDDKLPPPLERKYKKNHLAKVIVRFDFATPITLSVDLRKKLISHNRKEFPLVEEAKRQEGEFQINPIAGEFSQIMRPTNDRIWVFKNSAKGKQFNVAESDCSVEYSKYESFEQLMKDLSSFTKSIYAQENDLQLKRLGIRYIDKIKFDKEDDVTNWSNYLKPDLTAAFNLVENKSVLTRVISVVECAYDNEVKMRLVFGMMNPDFPQTLKQKIFTIDHDVFTTEFIEKKDWTKKLNELRTKAKLSFESMILPGLRADMGLKS